MDHKKLPIHNGIDYTGNLINDWKILRLSDKKGKYGEIKWKCLCTGCNREYDVYKKALLNNKSKRCQGCAYTIRTGEDSPVWTGYKGISGTKFNRIKKRAKYDSIEFNITIKDLWNIWERQNGICALSEQELDLNKTASLDRIDSKKGYILGNVWWIHKDINFMKQAYDTKYFMEVCQKISNHFNKLKKEEIEFYQRYSIGDLILDE